MFKDDFSFLGKMLSSLNIIKFNVLTAKLTATHRARVLRLPQNDATPSKTHNAGLTSDVAVHLHVVASTDSHADTITKNADPGNDNAPRILAGLWSTTIRHTGVGGSETEIPGITISQTIQIRGTTH